MSRAQKTPIKPARVVGAGQPPCPRCGLPVEVRVTRAYDGDDMPILLVSGCNRGCRCELSVAQLSKMAEEVCA